MKTPAAIIELDRTAWKISRELPRFTGVEVAIDLTFLATPTLHNRALDDFCDEDVSYFAGPCDTPFLGAYWEPLLWQAFNDPIQLSLSSFASANPVVTLHRRVIREMLERLDEGADFDSFQEISYDGCLAAVFGEHRALVKEVKALYGSVLDARMEWLKRTSTAPEVPHV